MKQTQGNKLKQFLKHHNLKLSDVIDLQSAKGLHPVGIDRISNFINGKAGLHLDAIIKLSTALDCTPNDIIDFEDLTESN